jgi:hypothetical protein
MTVKLAVPFGCICCQSGLTFLWVQGKVVQIDIRIFSIWPEQT